MRIEIPKLSPYQIDACIELLDVFEEVFEMKHLESPSMKHLEELLQRTTSLFS